MAEGQQPRIVIHNPLLTGRTNSPLMQKVATVFVDRIAYRIYAPPEANGDALDWVPYLHVRHIEFSGESEAQEPAVVMCLKLLEDELSDQNRSTDGTHPDGVHCTAQICVKGHVQHCNGMMFDSHAHCQKCGSRCVDRCAKCKKPIRGCQVFGDSRNYERPQFCFGCGNPYPWMEERLRTARDLLWHDDRLSLEDRESLWDELQYVMSDPKADLVPAKKKLISIRLEKAGTAVREFVKDVLAQALVESIKP